MNNIIESLIDRAKNFKLSDTYEEEENIVAENNEHIIDDNKSIDDIFIDLE